MPEEPLKDSIHPLGWNQRHENQAAETPANQPERLRRTMSPQIANPDPLGLHPQTRQDEPENAPRSKLMQKVGKIKIDRLRSMDRFSKSADEFFHHHFL